MMEVMCHIVAHKASARGMKKENVGNCFFLWFILGVYIFTALSTIAMLVAVSEVFAIVWNLPLNWYLESDPHNPAPHEQKC